MSTDNVSTAFKMILEEINLIVSEVKAQTVRRQLS